MNIKRGSCAMSDAVRHFQGALGGTVFVSPLRSVRAGKGRRESCRLFTLPGWIPDLHSFAEVLDLRRSWFTDQVTMPHYLLTRLRRRRAVALGAVEIEDFELMGIIGNWRAAMNTSREKALFEQELADAGSAENCFSRSKRQQFLRPAEVTAEFARARRLLGAKE